MPSPIETFAPGQTLTAADLNLIITYLESLAPLDSAPLTGTPTCPTPAVGTNSTLIANCAFVAALVKVASIAGLTGTVTAAQLLAALATSPASFAGITSTGAYTGKLTVFDGFTGAFKGLANYTVTVSDQCVIVNKIPVPPATSTGPTTLTLPALGRPGTPIELKDGKGDASVNPITIVPPAGSGATIDNASQLVIDTPYGCFVIKDAGTQWSVISSR